MAYAIKKGSDYFNTVTYTGNGSTNAITVGFQPDLIWIKRRNGSPSDSNMIQDSVRGLDKFLITNGTFAEQSQNDSDGVTSYDTNGFTLGYTDSDAWNSNSNTYVAWNWKGGESTVENTDGSVTSQVSANPTSGFSIVTYTSNTGPHTVGHGLSQAPEVVIYKVRNYSDEYWLFGWSGQSGYGLKLNATDAKFVTSGWATMPTSTVFTHNVNASRDYVAYCFHSVEGFSKIGSYTGNGNSFGPFIYTGFRPAFVLIKRTDSSGYSWILIDSARDAYNVSSARLIPDSSSAEATGSHLEDFVSNGFKLRGTTLETNASGATYIYMAFAETPFKFANAR